MGKKIYISNLPLNASESLLSELFTPFGYVEFARISRHQETGASRGFAIVEMGTERDARKAIAGLNGRESQGRPLVVSEFPTPQT